jgi:hypothetical protein
MSDFVFLFRIGEAEQREAMGTPERAQQSMKAWLAWVHDLEVRGHLKARGQPLERAGRVVRGVERVVTDGPFVEVKDLVAGFNLVSARDFAEAVELAKACPILEGGGSVEIRPIMTSM